VSERHAYFFKGSGYLRYNIDTDFVDVGPAPIAQFWTHLPKEFQSNLDAVVNWGDGHAYFFKGAGYVRYNIVSDFVDVGPAPIAQFWTHLPKEFQSSLGAAVNWFPVPRHFPKATPGVTCFTRVPTDGDTLVVDGVEYTKPVDALSNWKDGKKIFHGSKPPTVGQPQCRSPKQVNAIVLHETVGWTDNPATDRWLPGFASQFYVQSDSSIAQHYDVVQLVQHAEQRNRHSVGIEFVNQVWASAGDAPGGVFRPPAGTRNRSPREVLPARPPPGGKEKAIWGERAFYIVPPADQLEALWQLVKLLLDTVPAIPRVWLSLEHSEANNLFLMSKWPELYGCPHPTCSRAGIYSHYNVGGHTDGSFLTLYTWLRQQGLSSGAAPGSAFQTAKDLVRNHLIPLRGRRFVDVAPFLS
jgi:Hemopexin/N-acetylmuramoyl-L-alanine amidase